MPTYMVTIEYPGGTRSEEIEAETLTQAEDLGSDLFFSLCNYGVSEVESGNERT